MELDYCYYWISYWDNDNNNCFAMIIMNWDLLLEWLTVLIVNNNWGVSWVMGVPDYDQYGEFHHMDCYECWQ